MNRYGGKIMKKLFLMIMFCTVCQAMENDDEEQSDEINFEISTYGTYSARTVSQKNMKIEVSKKNDPVITFKQRLHELQVLENCRQIKHEPTEQHLKNFTHELSLSDRKIVELSTYVLLWHSYLLGESSGRFSNGHEFFLPRVQLTSLDLSKNQLTELPDELSEISTLTAINLSENKFVKIPEVVYTITGLKYLDLSRNQLVTFTEEGISRLREVQCLNLAYNNLMRLPKSLCALTTLVQCQLYGNSHIKASDYWAYSTPPFEFKEPQMPKAKGISKAGSLRNLFGLKGKK